MQKFVDISNSNYYIDPADAGVALTVAGTINSNLGSFSSGVTDGASAVGFTLNTNNTLTTAGAKLLSLQNNDTEMFYVDKDGNVWAKGSFYADRGFGVQMKNVGSALSAYDLVVINTTENATDGVPRMMATTSAYAKNAFGVVQTTCAINATCNVVFQGKSLINVADSTNPGDYLFSSDTAGKATSGTKQYDGLLGTATSSDITDPYQVEMVFLGQPSVSTLSVADKNLQHAGYREAAIDYEATDETNRYTNNDENVRKGLYFDTFSDAIKVDSANLTVALDMAKRRAGLWGGVTMNATNTDSSGNTYLGAADANEVQYYDRSQTGNKNANQDSTTQTLVDLGVDPNWYNGVTLDASPSASVLNQAPANLSASYNGSLVKVSGRYATGEEDGPILITIKSDNEATASGNPSVTFDWRTNGHGGTANHSGTNITVDKSSSYILETGTNDVTITFSHAQYHPGDIFKIASWYLEPETANDRGEKQAFPLHANIIASDDYLDILDADTNKLWMRFAQGTDYLLGVAANNTLSGIQMLNGKLYVSMNGSAATGLYEIDFIADSGIKYNTTAGYRYLAYLQSRNTDPGDAYHINWSDSVLAIVGNAANDVSVATVPNHETKEVTLTGWGWHPSATNFAVVYGQRFVDTPRITASSVGYSASQPYTLSDCITASSDYVVPFGANGRYFYMQTVNGARCYSWSATGKVAPMTLVAVGTDDGASIISPRDTFTTEIYYDASYEQIKKLWLTSNGDLYYALKHNTNDDWRFWKIKYTAGWLGTLTGANTIDVNYSATSQVSPIPSLTEDITGIMGTEGTSTMDGKSNTIYISTVNRLTVLNEITTGQQIPLIAPTDRYTNVEEFNSSVKYITKDYISEEMIGYHAGMWPFYGSGAIANNTINIPSINPSEANLTAKNGGTGMTYASGVRGTGINFDGTDDYLCSDTDDNTTCNDNGTFDGWTNYTAGAWVKRDTTSANGYIIDKGSTGEGFGWYIYSGGDGNFVMYSNTGSNYTATSQAHEDTNWHHVVAVFKGSTGEKYIYVDGVQEGYSSGSTVGATVDTATPLIIGAQSRAAPTSFFDGTIDEPFFTGDNLTPEQIRRMYETGRRALNGAHGINDYKNNLDEDGTGFGAVAPIQSAAVSGKSLYVASNDTTSADDGYINKIDLSNDTVTQYYRTSTDPSIPDNDATTLSASKSGLELVGMEGVGAVSPGYSAQGNDASGTYYSDTVTLPDNISSAYLWVNEYIDSDCTDCSIAVSASNDGGTTYVSGVLTNTDSNQSLPEKEYFFPFDAPGNQLKVRFVFTRDSALDANIYIEKYGVTWFNDDDIAALEGSGGLFTNNNSGIANGSYLEVVHNQNTTDVLATGWEYSATASSYIQINEPQGQNYVVSASPDDQLKGWWKMEEASGDLTDQSRWTNTLIDKGSPTYQQTGKVDAGYSINLNGSTDYFCSGSGTTCADDNDLDMTSSFTVGTWVKFDTLPTAGNYMVLLDKYDTAGAGYEIDVFSVNNVRLVYANGGSEGTEATYNFETGKWYYIVGVHNDSTDINSLYINGSLLTSETGNVLNAANSVQPFNLGRLGVLNTRYLDGSMDEPFIYNTALSSDTIQNLYQYGTKRYKTEVTDSNTVRLYNYSGSTQNLRLDVIAGSITQDTGNVSLSPASADVDADANRNSIWINKTDESGRLIRLQNDGVDRFSVGWDGHATVSGSLTVNNGLTFTPQASSLTTAEGSVYYDSDVDHLYLRGGDAAWHRVALDMTKYSNSDVALAHEGTLTITHNQNTYDVLATGWEYNATASAYSQISEPQGQNHVVSASPDDQLKGWWKMEEASGDLTDSSRWGNTLIDKGTPTYSVAGKVDGGDAVDLNGTTDYFCTGSGTTCADDDDFDFTGDFSVGAWVKTDDLTGSGHMIATKYTTNDGIFSLNSGAGAINFNVYNTNANTAYLQATTTNDYVTGLDDDKWHFIVGTVTGNTLQLYVDGQLISSDTDISGTRDTSSAAPFMIGFRGELPAGYYYNGSMDEVFAYSRSLTMEEIRDLYHYGTKRYKIATPTANTATLTNLSGATQNVRLDVVVQGADLAEWYPTTDESVESGDLVALDSTASSFAIKKSSQSYDPNILGIISTRAGQELSVPAPNRRLVALSGRVPVKVASTSAAIAIGDYLTSSSEAGKAMKAIFPGRVVGRALENWTPDSGKTTILTFIGLETMEQPSFTLDDYGEISLTATPSAAASYHITDAFGQIINNLGAFSQAIVGNLTVGSLTGETILSPMAEFTQLKVETISPIASDSAGIAVKLGDYQTFTITNNEGSHSAVFDSEGNASLSGLLTTNELTVNDASVAGTLYADRIVTRFGELTSSPSAIVNNVTIQQFYNATSSSAMNDERSTMNVATAAALLALGASADDTDVMLEKDYTITESLSVLGDTMLGNTTVTGSLLAGAIHFDGNSLETFSDTLYLQKSRLASLDIMGGTIVVNNTGNVVINGNVDISGNLAVRGVLGVSKLDAPDGLLLSLGKNASGSGFASLVIKDANDNVVASIDASGSAKFLGNVEASGSGTFTKVNIATGVESTASASIGQGVLAASQTSVTIYNGSVTADSLIFITPTTVTDKILSVVDKITGAFTVSTTSAPAGDIKFNYWVVN